LTLSEAALHGILFALVNSMYVIEVCGDTTPRGVRDEWLAEVRLLRQQEMRAVGGGAALAGAAGGVDGAHRRAIPGYGDRRVEPGEARGFWRMWNDAGAGWLPVLILAAATAWYFRS
jgi:hypothetical protein